MKSLLTILFIGHIICTTSSCKKDDNTQVPVETNYVKTTLQYKSIIGINANLLSLDIYNYSQSATPKPVVIYVHGGGWRQGDKSQQLDNKLRLFNSLNYIFISINYRLSPSPFDILNPARIKYPDHNNDVADAVKWIYDNIGSYGGNSQKIALLGHSAGAHLVSLTGTSQEFLPAKGMTLNTLKGIASIDTEGYDVPSQSGEDLYKNAFGTDNTIHMQASPVFNLVSSVSYPKFFVAKRGEAIRINIANAFINKLQSVGVMVSEVTGSMYDHEGINDAIGNPKDTVITPALVAFFGQCFQ